MECVTKRGGDLLGDLLRGERMGIALPRSRVGLGCRTGVGTRNGNGRYYGVMTFVSVGLAPRFFLADAAGYGDALQQSLMGFILDKQTKTV